jgi:large subunit ribosomal protein L5
MSRLRDIYVKDIVPKLQKDMGIKNIMSVPKIKKITLNMGVGQAIKDKGAIARSSKDLSLISCQKPIITKAKKSIAGFKIRTGWPIGCKVTLRKSFMYDFLDRLISVVIPRIRDFRGLTMSSFDGKGNYSMGIKDYSAFPEIDYEKSGSTQGLDIAITTSACNDELCIALLNAFNFPLKNKD